MKSKRGTNDPLLAFQVKIFIWFVRGFIRPFILFPPSLALVPHYVFHFLLKEVQYFSSKEIDNHSIGVSLYFVPFGLSVCKEKKYIVMIQPIRNCEAFLTGGYGIITDISGGTKYWETPLVFM